MEYSFKPKEIVINEWSSKRQGSWSLHPKNGIQVIHLSTGTVIEVDEYRHQYLNRNEAFLQLEKKLQQKGLVN
jgi:protein subunit release factor A